jgi:hypothetical protein
MFFGVFCHFAQREPNCAGLRRLYGLVLPLAIFGVVTAWGTNVEAESKKTIGSIARLTVVNAELTFPARIDTGAQSCSLHVEKIEIKDAHDRRTRNVGKRVRILLKGEDGKTRWIESTIAKAVKVKSSSLKAGEYDHRYKVRLTLKWKGFEKEVLVTLNDRTDMEFPLLIGRNFLRGDFLVDVEKKD